SAHERTSRGTGVDNSRRVAGAERCRRVAAEGKGEDAPERECMEEDLSGLREEPAVYQDGLPEVLPEGKEEERLAEREAQEDAALMENPATWDLTEEIIAEAIRK